MAVRLGRDFSTLAQSGVPLKVVAALVVPGVALVGAGLELELDEVAPDAAWRNLFIKPWAVYRDVPDVAPPRLAMMEESLDSVAAWTAKVPNCDAFDTTGV